MTDENFEALAAALVAHSTFIDRATLRQIVASRVPAEQAESVATTIFSLNRTIRDSSDSIDDAIASLKSAMIKFADEFTKESAEALATRLRRLISTPQGLARQKKAELLSEATGNELAELDIVCDLRPVFDDDRKTIEGAVIVTTLRLEVQESDGRLKAIECHMTAKQLDRLCQSSEAARRKISAMKDCFSKLIPLALVRETPGGEK